MDIAVKHCLITAYIRTVIWDRAGDWLTSKYAILLTTNWYLISWLRRRNRADSSNGKQCFVFCAYILVWRGQAVETYVIEKCLVLKLRDKQVTRLRNTAAMCSCTSIIHEELLRCKWSVDSMIITKDRPSHERCPTTQYTTSVCRRLYLVIAPFGASPIGSISHSPRFLTDVLNQGSLICLLCLAILVYWVVQGGPKIAHL